MICSFNTHVKRTYWTPDSGLALGLHNLQSTQLTHREKGQEPTCNVNFSKLSIAGKFLKMAIKCANSAKDGLAWGKSGGLCKEVTFD